MSGTLRHDLIGYKKSFDSVNLGLLKRDSVAILIFSAFYVFGISILITIVTEF